MPIHKEGSGVQWGSHGKVYHGPDAREKAEKQAAAAHANGYRGDAMREDRNSTRAASDLANQRWHPDRNDAEETKSEEEQQRELEAMERERDGLDRDSEHYKELSAKIHELHRKMEGERNFKQDASEGEISERIKREYNRGHPLKQAEAIAYSELGESRKDSDEDRW